MSCPKGETNEIGLCYKPCKQGYTGNSFLCWEDCPKNFTDQGAFCKKTESYGRGAGHLSQETCDNSTDHGSKTNGCEQYGMWYPKCDKGYHNFGCCVCSPDCPNGWTDIGISCAKPSPYGRGAGHETQSYCESSGDHGAKGNGCEKYGLLWYPKCDNSFHSVGCCICSPNCPNGFTDQGEFCLKPSSYGRGAGHETQQSCVKSGDHDANTNGCEQYGLWYPKCDQGYNNFGCCTCSQACPEKWTDIGISCAKPTYSRGVGTIPDFGIIRKILIYGGIFLLVIIIISILISVIKNRLSK